MVIGWDKGGWQADQMTPASGLVARWDVYSGTHLESYQEEAEGYGEFR
jgi:hypothetical protein